MSNSRRLRRRLARHGAKPRFPEKPPALSTVRRWIRQAVAEGGVERVGVERTGKPGRPANLYQLTAKGHERAGEISRRDVNPLTELQAKRAHALMKKGMSEQRAIAAVTKHWERGDGR